jgi:deoxyhypusine synthase
MGKLSGRKIHPKRIGSGTSVVDLVDHTFLSYNAGRLREGCRLLAERMLREDVILGMSVSGALSPAGIGMSCLIPLMEAGFVDWIVSTGANLYHDTHFAIGLDLHQGSPFVDDIKLREEGIVRIYDILFDYEVLLSTDNFYRRLIRGEEFQRTMGTAEFHYLVGKYLSEKEKALGQHKSVLSTAFECGIPVYTSSPGDSSIGMNIAATALEGNKLILDPNIDVNETTSIVLEAKTRVGKSAVLLLGGGSPKNFVLQTEPQLQEVLGIGEKGHDYFLQVTDARPDTGGLSGATPGEAVSWGKVDPERLPDSVVCYCDTTIALPILTAYVLERVQPRPLRRLYDRRSRMLEDLRSRYNIS